MTPLMLLVAPYTTMPFEAVIALLEAGANPRGMSEGARLPLQACLMIEPNCGDLPRLLDAFQLYDSRRKAAHAANVVLGTAVPNIIMLPDAKGRTPMAMLCNDRCFISALFHVLTSPSGPLPIDLSTPYFGGRHFLNDALLCSGSWATEHGQHAFTAEMLHRFIALGADVNAVDINGHCPLMLLCCPDLCSAPALAPNYEVIIALLTSGLVNIAETRMETTPAEDRRVRTWGASHYDPAWEFYSDGDPRRTAVRVRSTRRRGASGDEKKIRHLPIHSLIYYVRQDTRTAEFTPLFLHTVSQFIASGANLDSVDGFGHTPLEAACASHYPMTGLYGMLLKGGASPGRCLHTLVLHWSHQCQKRCATANPPAKLYKSVITSFTAVLSELLAHSVDINSLGAEGATPLLAACQLPAPCLPIIEVLLSCGADVSIPNCRGELPLLELLRRHDVVAGLHPGVLVTAFARLYGEDDEANRVFPLTAARAQFAPNTPVECMYPMLLSLRARQRGLSNAHCDVNNAFPVQTRGSAEFLTVSPLLCACYAITPSAALISALFEVGGDMLQCLGTPERIGRPLFTLLHRGSKSDEMCALLESIVRLLPQHPEFATACTQAGASLLMGACLSRSPSLRAITALLGLGQPVVDLLFVPDTMGDLPLHVLMAKLSFAPRYTTEGLRLLMDALPHSVWQTIDANGRTPFITACAGFTSWYPYRIIVVATLLSYSVACGINVRAVDVRGATGLHYLTRGLLAHDRGPLPLIADYLAIDRSAANQRDASGTTPLFIACGDDHCAPCLKGICALLRGGADPNMASNLDGGGELPFFSLLSSCVKHEVPLTLEVIAAFVDAGVHLNTPDPVWGATMLAQLCAMSLDYMVVEEDGGEALAELYVECIPLLIRAGADPSIADRDGHLPLPQLLSGMFGFSTASQLETVLAAFASSEWFDINQRDGCGRTAALCVALPMFRTVERCRALLRYKPDLNIPDYVGRTPLHLLVNDWGVSAPRSLDREQIADTVAMLEMMCAHGADVEALDIDGRTPLVALCQSAFPYPEFMEVLLRYGATLRSDPLSAGGGGGGGGYLGPLMRRPTSGVNLLGDFWRFRTLSNTCIDLADFQLASKAKENLSAIRSQVVAARVTVAGQKRSREDEDEGCRSGSETSEQSISLRSPHLKQKDLDVIRSPAFNFPHKVWLSRYEEYRSPLTGHECCVVETFADDAAIRLLLRFGADPRQTLYLSDERVTSLKKDLI